MIRDENDPVMQQAARNLLAIVSTIMRKGLNQSSYQRLLEEIRNHRTKWKHKGVDFPVMVPVLIETNGTMMVHIMSRDLPRSGIEAKVVEIVRETANVDMRQVAKAFAAAFPESANWTM